MADTPKGLLTEEQQNLLVQVINTETEPIPVSGPYLQQLASVVSNSVSVSATPKAGDILNVASNLSAVIPTGFLLLHNDLDDLSKKLGEESSDSESGSSESGFSLLSILKPMLVGAGAAVVAAGLVKGLFGGVSDRTTNHVQELVDGLNERLTVDDLANDQTVLTAQKIGFIAYMEAYFLQQAASMTISGVLEAVGTSAGKAVRGFFTSLFGMQEEEDKVASKLKAMVEDIIMAQASDNYIGDEAVSKAVKIGIIAYIATYFATQTTAMATDTILSGLASAAGGAINSFFTSLFGIGGPKSYDKIQSIIDDIINAQSSDNYIGDEEVATAVKGGIVKYIEVYFKTQALNMAADTVSSTVGSSIANAVTSFFSTLFGREQEDPSGVDKLKEIADTLMQQLNVQEAVGWEEIQQARRDGVKAYITTYFEALVEQAGRPESKQNVAEKALNAVAGFLGKLFGREDDASQAQAEGVAKIIDAMLSDIDADTLSQDSELQQAKKEGIKSYVTSYFASMATVLADKSKNDIKKGYDKYAEDPYWGTNTFRGDGLTPEEFFAKIVKLTFKLDDNDMPSASELSTIKKQSVLNTAKAILNAEITSISKNINFDDNNIVYNVQSETTVSASTVDPNSASMLQTLNTISETLIKLSSVIEDIKDNGSGTTIINTSNDSGIDTNINIPG